jgi:hypothetical protein
MTKLTSSLGSLGLALVVALSLTGCELYFGDHSNQDDNWSYCGSDGFYTCQGDNCEWAGAQCPAGGGSGYTCTQDSDCAAGCYCQDGTCEEAGFCATNADCPDGFHCDGRSSCVPDTCASDADCLAGQTCNNGGCETTCVCENDAQAIAGGYGYCDETRSTCMPGSDPAGSCAGQVTCNIVAPTCPAGEVPLILDGCYTGSCKAIAQCDAAPSCSALAHEPDCLADNTRCSAVYNGINCKKPDGTQCNAGDTNCTCESFQFASCQTRGPSPRMVSDSSGNFLDATGLENWH